MKTNTMVVDLVKMMRDNGVEAFSEAHDIATSIFSVFETEIATNQVFASRDEAAAVVQPRPRRRRYRLGARRIANRKDWTAAVGEFFLDVGSEVTKVRMKDVVNYVTENSDRTTISGQNYAKYIDTVEQCGWVRETPKGQRTRYFVRSK